MSKLDFFLIAGHGQGDPGAVGTFDGNKINEADLTRDFVTLLNKYLKFYGANVGFYPFEKNMVKSQDAKAYNNADQVIEIHFNSADPPGTGTEVLIWHEYKPDIYDEIILKTASLYWKNRGFKARTGLTVMRQYKALKTSFRLLEICFINNTSDMEIYYNKREEFAQKLARALMWEKNPTLVKQIEQNNSKEPENPTEPPKIDPEIPSNEDGKEYIIKNGKIIGEVIYNNRKEIKYYE